MRCFPCEWCTESNTHQQSHQYLRLELLNIQNCPWGAASSLRAAQLDLLQELGDGDESMVEAGERRQRAEAAQGKGMHIKHHRCW